MKKVIVSLLLIILTLNCSGCFSIVGSIIGYQSGELLAGLLIGAGIDAGVAIANEAKCEADSKVYELDSDKGQVKARLNTDDMASIVTDLEAVFVSEGWSYELMLKKIRQGKSLAAQWQVNNSQGDEFSVALSLAKRKLDLRVKSDKAELKAAVLKKLITPLESKLETK
ncbi:MAG: hypothetical protein JW745_00715 [Sedimentisphaerales bacterium]|nr:hypothetical protein [Sedimentisphaerales bacterium]MBN2841667.1 hypothetical protein [Sedimentisphaerales bacterium]